MREAGRNSGTMFFTEDSFAINHVYYEKSMWYDRYYYLDVPLGCTSKLAREGGLARRRISKKDYFLALADCLAKIDTYEAWASSIRRSA